MLNYVNEFGGLAYWAHPESNRERQELGVITMETRKYPGDILATVGATGVETAYQDTVRITEPNHEWDTALLQYLGGLRAKPLWGLGGVDFHKDTPLTRINHVQTVLLVSEVTEANVLDALRRGRSYALRRGNDYQLILHTFSVSDGGGGQPALAGETLRLTLPRQLPIVDIIVAAGNRRRVNVRVDLIRSGRLVRSFNGATPLRIVHRDVHFDASQAAYYRITVHGPRPNYIISNPIFVRPAVTKPAGTKPTGTKKGR